MKKKIISLISIFILSFSLAFSFFDKVSFAADPVTYVWNNSSYHGTFGSTSGFTPFIVYGHINDGYNTYIEYIVMSNGLDLVPITGSGHNGSIGGYPCQYFRHVVSRHKDIISISPSVPVLDKDFDNESQLEQYIGSIIEDPSQLPINVTTYDSSLGSLQLKDSTSWRLLRYEPLFDDSQSAISNLYKVKLRVEFLDTTSTGQSYDKIQVMVRVNNIRSQFLAANTYPWKDKLGDYGSYSYFLSDLKSPTIVDLQTLDYQKHEDSVSCFYPLFQPCIDHFGLTKPFLSNDYWFLCDYTVCYRPVTTDGKFGDWFYISPESSYIGHNIDAGSSSISSVTGTSISDEDPNSLSFNPLPEDSTSSRTAIGKGSTLGDAISDSNNSLVGGGLTSGGSLTSNITDLFSFFSNLPLIISTIFGWLPPWVLSLFAIGFALFVPIFIYKFVRG